jgi:hypothetical protein
MASQKVDNIQLLSLKLCRNSPGEENRDWTGKGLLKAQVEAGFSWPKDALARIP